LALNNKLIGNDEIVIDKLPDLNNYANRILNYLKIHQIILPKRIVYPYSLALSYMENHYSEDYRKLKNIFHEFYPEYYESFIFIFEKNNKLSSCNIFITHYQYFVQYCEWLFPLLFQFEKIVNVDNYDEYQKRIYGFISERLLNVFVYHNKFKAKYKPLFIIDPDKEDKKYSFFSEYKSKIKKQLSFFFQR
jgi:hypothetical protein